MRLCLFRTGAQGRGQRDSGESTRGEDGAKVYRQDALIFIQNRPGRTLVALGISTPGRAAALRGQKLAGNWGYLGRSVLDRRRRLPGGIAPRSGFHRKLLKTEGFSNRWRPERHPRSHGRLFQAWLSRSGRLTAKCSNRQHHGRTSTLLSATRVEYLPAKCQSHLPAGSSCFKARSTC